MIRITKEDLLKATRDDPILKKALIDKSAKSIIVVENVNIHGDPYIHIYTHLGMYTVGSELEGN